jgi:anti-sigma regulatory factor (Ser/Thr protein kinase)/predicted transcriptional regulator
MFANEVLTQLTALADVEADRTLGLGDESAPRIAVYDDPRTPPRTLSVPESRLPDLIDVLASRTYDLARQQGSRIPYTVLRELVENLIHASFTDVVITILDGGNTIRISDRGPGIGDKRRALEPGFTTAGPEVKRFIKGVGSGLPIARESLEHLHGILDIEDNLGAGTVITVRMPSASPDLQAERTAEHPRAKLTDRQLKVVLLLIELGPVGPTRIAQEMGVSPSTAYRDLVYLQTLNLVTSSADGLRSVTDSGLQYLEAVL